MSACLPNPVLSFFAAHFQKLSRPFTGVMLALALVGLGLFSGCDKFSKKEIPGSDPVKAVEAQVQALNDRDADGAISWMHPEAPGREKALTSTKRLLQSYDLMFMLQGTSLESSDGTEARVRFTQVTHQMAKKAVAGGDFRNNRLIGVHTLRKDGDQWKIYNTEVEKLEYFDQMERTTPPPSK